MRAQIGKYGVRHDYRGAHVTLDWRGRTLLGTIMEVRRDETLGVWVADVRHFCGDAWPITPRLDALEILERDTEQDRYAQVVSGIDSKACDRLNAGLRKVWSLD